jgi:hypothetical protein
MSKLNPDRCAWWVPVPWPEGSKRRGMRFDMGFLDYRPWLNFNGFTWDTKFADRWVNGESLEVLADELEAEADEVFEDARSRYHEKGMQEWYGLRMQLVHRMKRTVDQGIVTPEMRKSKKDC